nr:FHA domain-containing protein [candidate division Zixibacteria bacterium]
MTNRIVLQELGSLRKHRIDLPCILGRGNQANLTFLDSTISQRHALIAEIDDQIWIEDLKSSNGVYVNDQKIKEKTLLKPGDSVQLGQTEFLVCQAEEDISEQTVVLHSLDPKAEWKSDHERLRLIYEITTALSENQDLAVLGEAIFSRFKEIFKQDRGYLALFEEDGTLEPIFLDPSSKPVPLSRSIINRLFQTGESLLLEDALSEAPLKEQESIVALRIRSALCVPLIYHDQIYGLIYLDRNIPGAYGQDDLEFLRTIAFILAPLMENARLWSELENRYASAMETLKKTQARLIDMERTAAYVRLAQAMAHEIRNPLMVIGGLVK